jgi:hypothetical protein
MDIEAFVLCDAATDQNGKLNVLGAFDAIFSSQVPTMHPACAVALRIRFSRIEEGRHSFRICVIDEDGAEVFPKLEGTISVKVAPKSDSTAVNVVANLQRLQLPGFGKYSIDLAIDGRQIASLPLILAEAPPHP